MNDDEFIEAARNGDLEMVRLLINEVNPATRNNCAIRMASLHGHSEVVKLLLQDERVDPTADDNYAIHGASYNGHVEVVRLLLQDERVDPTVINNASIIGASQYGHTEVVKLLLQDGRVNPSARGNRPIQLASRNGHTEAVKLLLNDGRVDWRLANPDIKNELIKTSENNLKSELTNTYLTLKHSSPKVMGYPGIPKELLKQTAYLVPYQELCDVNSEIPPVKLVALAKILKVNHDDTIEWSKLCEKVKRVIVY